MSKELTTEQINTLERCEKIIEKGQETFVEVGQALAIIRDNKLWKQGYGSFVEYVEERWGYGKSHAYRLIKAAEDVEPCQFSPVGENCQESSFVPGNERQAREIAKAGGEESQAEVAQAVTERCEETGEKPTAKVVKEEVGAKARVKNKTLAKQKSEIEEAIEQGKAYCNEIRKAVNAVIRIIKDTPDERGMESVQCNAFRWREYLDFIKGGLYGAAPAAVCPNCNGKGNGVREVRESWVDQQ